MADDKLTIRQEKFCIKYLECGTASEAYRHAYNCEKMCDNAIWREASLLLKNPKVAQRISHLRDNLAEAAGVSALRIVLELKKIAFSDATKVRKNWTSLKDFEALSQEERACIKSVETKVTKRETAMGDWVIDEQVKITCYDKQRALESLVDILGYKAPERKEVTGKNGKPLYTDIQVEIIDSRDKVDANESAND